MVKNICERKRKLKKMGDLFSENCVVLNNRHLYTKTQTGITKTTSFHVRPTCLF